jgi:hypothetical protein
VQLVVEFAQGLLAISGQSIEVVQVAAHAGVVLGVGSPAVQDLTVAVFVAVTTLGDLARLLL